MNSISENTFFEDDVNSSITNESKLCRRKDSWGSLSELNHSSGSAGSIKKTIHDSLSPSLKCVTPNSLSTSEPALLYGSKEFVDCGDWQKHRLVMSQQHSARHIQIQDSEIYEQPSSIKSLAMPSIDIETARLRSSQSGPKLGETRSLMLGEDDLERLFPDRKVNILVSTWNMNGQVEIQKNTRLRMETIESISDFLLPRTLDVLPDIYAIGIQDACPQKKKWEAFVQATIGPSHVMIHSVTSKSLHLAIFVRRDLIWFCSEAEDQIIITRISSVGHSKGAVAICFYLFGSLFLFVNCNLPENEDFNERINDYQQIYKTITIPKYLPSKNSEKGIDLAKRFDHVYWFGSLNFRVSQSKKELRTALQSVPQLGTSSLYKYILNFDQLKDIIKKEKAFTGFNEAPILFAPSHKFSIDPEQVASYADRILFKSLVDDSLCCDQYTMVETMNSSNRNPIIASFKVIVQPGNDTIPLSAGSFDRDIYLKGLEHIKLSHEAPGLLAKSSKDECSII